MLQGQGHTDYTASI